MIISLDSHGSHHVLRWLVDPLQCLHTPHALQAGLLVWCELSSIFGTVTELPGGKEIELLWTVFLPGVLQLCPWIAKADGEEGWGTEHSLLGWQPSRESSPGI